MTTTLKKEELRTCRLCGEEKKVELFEIDSRVKGKYTTRCKTCKAGLNDKARTLYSSLKYRANEAGQPLEVTLKELRALLAAFDGMCVYCDATEDDTGRPHHVDHIVAVSKGGRHSISNLVVACASCNAQKGNRPFFEFYKMKKDEIGDDNFTTLLYYVSFMSEQPLEEVFKDFLTEYLNENYPRLKEVLNGEELELHIDGMVQLKLKTERAS